ncbi:MAG: hypothetical protein FD152_3113 [Xanthobacteraceae bacterium]|nr:MAG: hypothetical protein FD152_3113 [Xanthobacteraceae bacterium]
MAVSAPEKKADNSRQKAMRPIASQGLIASSSMMLRASTATPLSHGKDGNSAPRPNAFAR